MSLATIWAEVESDAKAAVANVEGGIERLAEQIGPVIVTDAEALLKQLLQLSITAVIAQAGNVISGSEKFGAAVADVTQTVEAQGKSIIITDVQSAVQGAYNAVKLAVSNPAVATVVTGD